MYSMLCPHPDTLAINLRGNDLEGERWWVCSVCGKPREEWLRSLGDVMLNYFKGGDLDGRAYATSTLLDHQYLMEGYNWSPDVMISDKVPGATARVWLYQDETDRAIAAIDHELDKTMTQLEERRKSLGVSRALVADQAGLTLGVLTRIEHGGPRTKPDEIKIVNDALDQIEAKSQAQVSANPT